MVEVVGEVSGDPKTSGQPAAGCISLQNQPVSVSQLQTTIDTKHPSSEEDEVICLPLRFPVSGCFMSLLVCYFLFDGLKVAICYKVIVSI